MKTLHIIASPRGQRSKSRVLGEFFTQQLTGDIITLDLNTLEIPFVSNDLITYNYVYMSYEALSEEDKKIADIQKSFIQQLKNVDAVVVSAPLWNFGMPAILKAYIDLVSKVGETFTMSENGLKGLLTNIQKLYIITSKGSVYKNMAWQDIETLEKNIQQAFAFLGVPTTKVFTIEGTTQKDEKTLEADIQKIQQEMVASL